MDGFKIEKGVPRRHRGQRGLPTFPLKHMEVGDSFLVPIPSKEEIQKIRMRLYQAAWRANVKVSTAINEDGMRVWLDGPRDTGEKS